MSCSCPALAEGRSALCILNLTLSFIDKYMAGNALAMDQVTKRADHKLPNVQQPLQNISFRRQDVRNKEVTSRASGPHDT